MAFGNQLTLVMKSSIGANSYLLASNVYFEVLKSSIGSYIFVLPRCTLKSMLVKNFFGKADLQSS